MTRPRLQRAALAALLTLAGCGAPPWKPTPLDVPLDERGGASPAPASSRFDEPPVIPSPVPRVLPVQPEIGAGSSAREPFLYQPGPTAPMPPARPLGPRYNGPITGYGPGGMGYPPGAPPNPPYFPGGIPH